MAVNNITQIIMCVGGCACVGGWVHMFVGAYVCGGVHMCVHMFVGGCSYVCGGVHMCVCICLWVGVHMCGGCAYVCGWVFICV